jgi:hypothetical protein
MNPNHVAIIMIVAIGVAYFIFLWASWQEFQKDRATRDSKIDELLERIPKPRPVADES